ncbi:putative cobalt transporter CbtA [Nocardioides ginsengisegetis]|uniref:Putative cobalt transporter CbtA n=1 Tax=Nocardioides ginsengisegetis TaxID=661491 RepID=A0A7W3J220_9ACTN|nr:CbtA family protein [Nocardioides ginsengisegetis]MBA8804841.1 putative cobalt transporter CbtA [Nocardioides ginsengisegetis]
MKQPWATRLGRGALAGLAGGVSAVAILWGFVEPALERAIALEDVGAGGHAHTEGAGVTRLQQQIGGTLTVVIVPVLLGLAFAVVYASSRHRLSGTSEVTRSVSLGGLAFFALALIPAILVPANPPGVGDPGTVNTRTLTYLLAILLGVSVVGAAFAIHARLQERTASTVMVRLQTVLVSAGLTAGILLLAPRVREQAPALVPSDLLWQFRAASLLQLAVMWLAMGLVLGLLERRADRSSRARVRESSARQSAV